MEQATAQRLLVCFDFDLTLTHTHTHTSMLPK